MKIDKLTIFIDNNVWDYFSDNKILLEDYFPQDEFNICITTHGKYEALHQTPKNKQAVKDYAKEALNTLVKEDSIFGFYSEQIPMEYQRLAGFNEGRWIYEKEATFRTQLTNLFGTQEKRKQDLILFKQEADIEIASRSISHPVITFEKQSKNGPLKYASQNGGKVVFLDLESRKKLPANQFLFDLIKTLKSFSK